MATKSTTKRNPTDTTLRNVRASVKRDADLLRAIANVALAVEVLRQRVSDLELKVAAGSVWDARASAAKKTRKQ